MILIHSNHQKATCRPSRDLFDIFKWFLTLPGREKCVEYCGLIQLVLLGNKFVIQEVKPESTEASGSRPINPKTQGFGWEGADEVTLYSKAHPTNGNVSTEQITAVLMQVFKTQCVVCCCIATHTGTNVI